MENVEARRGVALASNQQTCSLYYSGCMWLKRFKVVKLSSLVAEGYISIIVGFNVTETDCAHRSDRLMTGSTCNLYW